MMKVRQSKSGPRKFIGSYVRAWKYDGLQRWFGSNHAKALGITNNNDAIDYALSHLPGMSRYEASEKEAYATTQRKHQEKADIFVSQVHEDIKHA